MANPSGGPRRGKPHARKTGPPFEVQLRRSEANIRDFIENASVGLHWLGPDGSILWANQAELNLLGHQRGEYVGHHIAEFHADGPVIEDILARLGGGETLCEYEARLRHKDGSIRHVLINSNTLFEDGKFVHTRCFTHDITERKQAEEALRESERRVRDANAELALRVSDLQKANAEIRKSRRAALNLMEDAIQSRQAFETLNIQLQEGEGRLRVLADQLEQRVSERTQELVQSEDRLRTLATELNLAEQRERKRLATELHDYLAQLLVLGRMTLSQAKRFGLPPRGEDFVKQTEETLGKALTYCRTLMAELSPPVLQEQGLPAGLRWLADHMQRQELAVTVDVEQARDVPLPEDRAVLLFQSVRELLINVAKHGTVRKATVQMTHEDGLLRIVVRDENGFDLAAAAAAAASDNASPLSSKFGLFSIRERMKALGGRFDILSAPGEGTTATLTLPVAGSAESKVLSAEPTRGILGIRSSALPSNSAPSTQRSALQKNAPVRVLLVDDHTVMREGLRSIVTGYKHLEVVGEAGDGAEAVELAQRLDPDVVVMDINMPKMDGIEATRRIKADRPNTVVIGLSVNQSVDTEQKMKAAGAVAYLTKESATDALCHAIDKAVSHQQGAAAR